MAKFVAKRRPAARRYPILPMVALVLLVVTVLVFAFNLFRSSDVRKVKAVIGQFYGYEQTGDFGSSWELFHSQMKERYPKDVYIQARAYIFMQQLGARSFSFDIGDATRVSVWRMEEEAEPLSGVYRTTVSQRMNTVFGWLELRQDVYAAREDGEWKLLWPFGAEEGGGKKGP